MRKTLHRPILERMPQPGEHRWRRALLFGAVLGALSTTGCSRIIWRPDLGGAMRLASEENRVVILAFWSSLNPDCVRMSLDVFSRKEVQQALRGTIPVRLDALLSSKLREEYGLRVVPSFIAFGPDGGILKVATGYMDEARFRGFVEGAKLAK